MARTGRVFSNKALVVAAAFAACCSATVAIADDDRYDEQPPAETFKVRIGAFFIDRFDTTARFDSRTVPLGTVINLEDSFNVDSGETVGRMDGFYRFNARHRIEWSYYASRRSGEAIAIRDIEIGDPNHPDGGFVIPKDAATSTQWNFDLLKVGYAWSFLNKRRYEWYIGAGLNIRDLDVDIAYQASVGSSDTISDNIDVKGILPLPTAVLGGRWNFNDKWQAEFRYEAFALEFEDYRGSEQDFLLLFEHNTFKNVGFGAGLNVVNLDLRAKDENVSGKFNSHITGLLGYVKFYY